jgi:hypothetical protein
MSNDGYKLLAQDKLDVSLLRVSAPVLFRSAT